MCTAASPRTPSGTETGITRERRSGSQNHDAKVWQQAGKKLCEDRERGIGGREVEELGNQQTMRHRGGAPQSSAILLYCTDMG